MVYRKGPPTTIYAWLPILYTVLNCTSTPDLKIDVAVLTIITASSHDHMTRNQSDSQTLLQIGW